MEINSSSEQTFFMLINVNNYSSVSLVYKSWYYNHLKSQVSTEMNFGRLATSRRNLGLLFSMYFRLEWELRVERAKERTRKYNSRKFKIIFLICSALWRISLARTDFVKIFLFYEIFYTGFYHLYAWGSRITCSSYNSALFRTQKALKRESFSNVILLLKLWKILL